MTAVAHVDGQIYARMLVDGQDIPHTPDAIETITITEGFGNVVPMLRLEIFDASGVFSYYITQGNLIQLALAKEPDEVGEDRLFRVFTVQHRLLERGPRLVIDCVLDVPGLLSSAGVEHYEGSSAEIAKKIVEQEAVEYSGIEGTNDKQVWIRAGTTRLQFLRQMILHGYLNDSSCLYHALTSRHKFRYVNLMQELGKEPKKHLMYNSIMKPRDGADGIIVDSVRNQSVSGVFNQWLNYGFRYMHHQLDGEHQDIDEFNMDFNGSFLPINEELYMAAEYSRVGYALHPDCGNTHENYYKALYQNQRGISLHSERMTATCFHVTDSEILNPVWFSHIDDQGEVDTRSEGVYMMMSKTIFIKNGKNYAEKFLLVRPYLNQEGSARLLS